MEGIIIVCFVGGSLSFLMLILLFSRIRHLEDELLNTKKNTACLVVLALERVKHIYLAQEDYKMVQRTHDLIQNLINENEDILKMEN